MIHVKYKSFCGDDNISNLVLCSTRLCQDLLFPVLL